MKASDTNIPRVRDTEESELFLEDIEDLDPDFDYDYELSDDFADYYDKEDFDE